MRTRFLLLCCSLCLLINPVVNAEIYKTVDKNGHTVYTDLPPANTTATPVELPNINTLPAPAADTSIYNLPQQAKPAAISYQVQITSPVNGATLMPNERNLNISVTIDKAILEGHLLYYFVDDKQVKETLDTTITVEDPVRGEHKLIVKVMDKEGNVFGESNTVTLVVIRPIAKQKAAPVPIKK